MPRWVIKWLKIEMKKCEMAFEQWHARQSLHLLLHLLSWWKANQEAENRLVRVRLIYEVVYMLKMLKYWQTLLWCTHGKMNISFCNKVSSSVLTVVSHFLKILLYILLICSCSCCLISLWNVLPFLTDHCNGSF